MTAVKDILTAELKAIGADGLYNVFCNCGCGLDDLMPCDHNPGECVPARKIPVPFDHEDYGYVECLYTALEATR